MVAFLRSVVLGFLAVFTIIASREYSAFAKSFSLYGIADTIIDTTDDALYKR